MKTEPYYVVKQPVVTEEAVIQQQTRNQYVFKVDPRANKKQIRDAIEKMFQVKVASVNTMNYLGKLGGRRGRTEPGRRPSWKKAIVTLRKGDTIELY